MQIDETCLPSSTLLNRTSSTPLSIQLEEIIRNKICSGEWAPGTMIPSENQLGKIYGLSRMTVRNVITRFVEQGVLFRIHGKGTFVRENKFEISGLQYCGLRQQLESQGHSVSTHLLSCEQISANDFVSKKLNLPVGESVYCIKRVRTVNGVKISYHKSFVPARLCPNLEQKNLQDEQLCVILSTDYLLVRGHIIETIESFYADETKSEYLDIKPGFPLLLLQDQLYTADNLPFEFSCVYFRGDKIKLHAEYYE